MTVNVMKKAIVCEIEKYATHDGPGIRSVVFFKGCPLRCLWCANPETQRKDNELYYNYNRCINCGSCLKACLRGTLSLSDKMVIDRERCIACGSCVLACPMSALNLVGKEMTVDEVFATVEQDMVFYRESGGGITLSGGEVLLQNEFAAELLQKCRQNYIHTAIETSGFGAWEFFKNIAEYTDLVLFDIKHTDDEKHKALTGVSNKLILENLSRLASFSKNIIIRVPLIPGINDSFENIEATIDLAKRNGIREIHLLPYHKLGRAKYEQLSKEYVLEEISRPQDGDISKLKELIEDAGLKCVIGG
jgi:pyruvate formate lyase activating enzyme